MALTPEQQEKTDSVQPGVAAADAFMAVFGFRRVIQKPACFCMGCDIAANHGIRSRMSLCPECGNKRCPKATHHDNKCTGSNEPGQAGSAY